jgi:hypothetical protein
LVVISKSAGAGITNPVVTIFLSPGQLKVDKRCCGYKSLFKNFLSTNEDFIMGNRSITPG